MSQPTPLPAESLGRHGTVAEALATLRDGRPIVVVDDADREDEGDLILPAVSATPEQVGFFVRHTSGTLCVALPDERAKALRLDPMVARNEAPLGTAFTVSVDYRHGLTTGISAAERALTISQLADNNSGADDFVRPGHVFPLIAADGGVLARSGHTEAAVDLARLAGGPPVGLLAECVDDAGALLRGAALHRFAAEHELPVLAIDALIAHRRQSETLVRRVREEDLVTAFGPARAITFAAYDHPVEHIVLDFRAPTDTAPPLVRFHRERPIEDLFGSQSVMADSLMHAGLERIAQAAGVFVYLRAGVTGVPATLAPSSPDAPWLDVGVGAQILNALELARVRVLAGRPTDYVGLEGYAIELVATELL